MSDTLAATYQQARDRFLAGCKAVGAQVTTYVHPKPGIANEEVGVDVAWVGDNEARDVVVVVSGTHGAEGYAGSALQSRWLERQTPLRPDADGVLLIHALNPSGFSWTRRVTHENVDLNRNFVDHANPPSNERYDEIAALVVPENWDDATQATSTEALLGFAGEWGFEAFQQAVSGGQFTHDTGVFYGGTEPTWSRRTLETITDQFLANRRRVAIIDLHTGLGPSGVGELISSMGPDDAEYRRSQAWFGDDVTSLISGDSVSAQLTGEWLPAIGERLTTGSGVEVTGVALEYGTVDPVSVLQALRADAWLHAHGDLHSAAADQIRLQVRNVFADDDPAWLAKIATRFDEVLGNAFTALA